MAIMSSITAGFVFRGVSPTTTWVSFAIGIIFGILAWIGISRRDGTGIGYNGPETFFPRGVDAWLGWRNWGWTQWAMVIAFSIYTFRAFCFVFYEKGPDLTFLYTWNYGDITFHLNFAHYLAKGAPFWPDCPIFPGLPLNYPFSVDFFSGLLTHTGLPITRAFIWMGLAGAIGAGIALWRWGGPFALAGFLFSGGTAGFAFFSEWKVMDYNDTVDWKSLPLALFITQRGLLYAIPCGVALLTAWRSRFLHRKPIMPLWVEVLLYATMPAMHMHTFVFLSFLLGIWVLLLPTRLRVLQFIFCSIPLGTVLFFLFAGGPSNGASVIHWKPGWMQNPNDPVGYWFKNFGILPLCVLSLVGFLAIRFWGKDRTKESKAEAFEHAAFVIPGILMFGLTCFISFSHWEWDNTKLMMWSIFCILPSLWLLLKRFHLAVRIPICFALFFSGFISVYAAIDHTRTGFSLVGRDQWEVVKDSLSKFPVDAVFVAEPIFTNLVTVLGHKTVVGYPGHILGPDLAPRLGDVNAILTGAPDWQERIKRQGVDYIFWGEQEKGRYKDTPKPWIGTCPVVVDNLFVTIYDVRAIKNAKN